MSFNKYTKKWLQYNASDLYDIYKIKYGKEFISEYLSDENVNYMIVLILYQINNLNLMILTLKYSI